MEPKEQPQSHASWCFFQRADKSASKLTLDPARRRGGFGAKWVILLSCWFPGRCVRWALRSACVYLRWAKEHFSAVIFFLGALGDNLSLLCLLREKQTGRRGRTEGGEEVEKVRTKSKGESSGFCSMDTPAKRCPRTSGTSLHLEASRNQEGLNSLEFRENLHFVEKNKRMI